MTTAHRPTFDPARGKETLRGPAYHQRLLPAYTQLKYRQRGQGGDADTDKSDLQAELLAAEAAHIAKRKGLPPPGTNDDAASISTARTGKRVLGSGSAADVDGDEAGDESPGAKRRRILEATRDIDADDSQSDPGSDGADNDDDDDDDDDSDDSSDDEDEEELLRRELERVKKEKAEKREKEEREKVAREQDARERDIALGNPLLNKPDFNIKRRWDDDVVFKNQARGTEDKGKSKEFINDMLRSDFHRRFMSKYVN